MKIALYCTGIMELAALAPALKSLFLAHDFTTFGLREAMPGQAIEPLPEFASSRINDQDALLPESVLRKYIIPRLAGALSEEYEHIILLSDLELKNVDQAPLVCDIVKHAIRLHTQTLDPKLAPITIQEFRERVSFHLAVPMVDSWLFGDPAVCKNNDIPLGRTPILAPGRDREQFLTADSAYEADDGSACFALLERAGRGAKRKAAPWMTTRRAEHPKHYLQWLCRDPKENSCTTWQETGAGARALAQLDWQAVLSLPNEYAFLHALIEDIADALGEPKPLVPAVKLEVPTQLRLPSERTYLRNECDYRAFAVPQNS